MNIIGPFAGSSRRTVNKFSPSGYKVNTGNVSYQVTNKNRTILGQFFYIIVIIIIIVLFV